MFELHGWLVLQIDEPYGGNNKLSIEEYDLKNAKFKEKFLAKVQRFHLTENIHQCKRGQWQYMFTFQGFHNHCHTEIYEIFKWVADHSKKSYGLLYTSDGEGEYMFDFRVWVLKDSQFTEHGDPFLSPRIPHIGFPRRGKTHKYQKGSL
ncbi:MAG: Imm7 family immunity protein [Armatimonas sp.]